MITGRADGEAMNQVRKWIAPAVQCVAMTTWFCVDAEAMPDVLDVQPNANHPEWGKDKHDECVGV